MLQLINLLLHFVQLIFLIDNLTDPYGGVSSKQRERVFGKRDYCRS